METYMHLCLPWLFKLLCISYITVVYKIWNVVMTIMVTSATICAWLLRLPIFYHSCSYANAPVVFSSADVSYLVFLLSVPPISMRNVWAHI